MGDALRELRARSRNKPQGHVTGDVVLSQRPAEAAHKAYFEAAGLLSETVEMRAMARAELCQKRALRSLKMKIWGEVVLGYKKGLKTIR